MRRSAIAFILVCSLAASCATTPPAPAYPRISIEYLGLLDNDCAALNKKPIDPAIVAEIERRLPEFRALWFADEPLLLAETVKAVGRPFGFREAVATAHACEGVKSMSYPLLVNVRQMLGTANGRFADRPDMFVDKLFHEVLHRYIGEITGGVAGRPARATPLIKKYVDESFVTKTHLHLFAIQRVVYDRLGRKATWAAMVADYRELPAYARALVIVENEGPEVFLAELRSH